MKRAKNPVSVTDLIRCIPSYGSNALASAFVASRERQTFHRPSCRVVKRMAPYQLVGYRTAENAKIAGCRPCRVCRPDENGPQPAVPSPLDLRRNGTPLRLARFRNRLTWRPLDGPEGLPSEN